MSHRVARHPITCEICETVKWMLPSQSKRTRYCSKPCASIGQGRRRRVWNKGLTTSDHPSMQRVSDAVRESMRINQSRGRGVNHPMYGKKHSPEALAKMSACHKRQTLTPGMRRGLEHGRRYFKGLTKATSPAVARRSAALSGILKGRKNPAHSEYLTRLHEQHPDKHPNRVLAQRGHETNIERLMRQAMTTIGLVFERQYHIGQFWVDFAFVDAHVVVEVDGAYWHDAARDGVRDQWMADHGWRVIRFPEKAVMTDASGCAIHVRAFLG